ncbi:MAG: MFS transporter, partial [Desulfobacterales bacterium]|nr:MFS transporter [Desulfobacterales bacterium]
MVNTQRAVWLSYALTTIFNCNLSLLVLFIPLYGLFLGVSLPSIGLLIAIPGFLQLCITLICGGLIDKWGEKTGYLLTYSFGVMAAVIFNFTNDFTLLAVAQVCNGLGRAFFWTSSQSYASR